MIPRVLLTSILGCLLTTVHSQSSFLYGEQIISLYGSTLTSYGFWLGIPYDNSWSAPTSNTQVQDFKEDVQAALSKFLGLQPDRITFPVKDTPTASSLISPSGQADPRLYIELSIQMPNYPNGANNMNPVQATPIWAWTTSAVFARKWNLQPFKCPSKDIFYQPGNVKLQKLCSYGELLGVQSTPPSETNKSMPPSPVMPNPSPSPVSSPSTPGSNHLPAPESGFMSPPPAVIDRPVPTEESSIAEDSDELSEGSEPSLEESSTEYSTTTNSMSRRSFLGISRDEESSEVSLEENSELSLEESSDVFRNSAAMDTMIPRRLTESSAHEESSETSLEESRERSMEESSEVSENSAAINTMIPRRLVELSIHEESSETSQEESSEASEYSAAIGSVLNRRLFEFSMTDEESSELSMEESSEVSTDVGNLVSRRLVEVSTQHSNEASMEMSEQSEISNEESSEWEQSIAMPRHVKLRKLLTSTAHASLQ